MKKKLLVVTALAGILAAGPVFAESSHHETAAPAATPPATTQPAAPMGQGMMMGQGGMGMMGQGGMMGGGMGMMGQGGMMGGGMGMMDGMMGKGMGCGMMGGGMGMMDGMMGTMTPDEQQKYLDATRDMRRKLHDKRFEYGEAARNPKTTKAELLKKRKEMWELQQKIHEKAWEFMKE